MMNFTIEFTNLGPQGKRGLLTPLEVAIINCALQWFSLKTLQSS